MSENTVERTENTVTGDAEIDASFARIVNLAKSSLANPHDAVSVDLLQAEFPWLSSSPGIVTLDIVTITISTLTLGAVQTMEAANVTAINALTTALQNAGIIKA